MYLVEQTDEVDEQVAALPHEALGSYAELRLLLELQPWSGDSLNRNNPNGEVRSHPFGPYSEGLAIYVILDQQRRVVLVRVLWLA